MSRTAHRYRPPTCETTTWYSSPSWSSCGSRVSLHGSIRSPAGMNSYRQPETISAPPDDRPARGTASGPSDEPIGAGRIRSPAPYSSRSAGR